MGFLKRIGAYFWNLIKSIGVLPWSLLTVLFPRVFRLIYHVISAVPALFVGLYSAFHLLFSTPGNFPRWLGKKILELLAWCGRIITKTLDVLLIGELLDLLFQLVKPNSRTLSEEEQQEARKVFGEAMLYWQVRIDEWSLIARLGALFAGTRNMGVTTFHTINFTRKIVTKAGNKDMEWLIHELAHISQMEHDGIQYIVEALIGQNTGGYDYGGPEELDGKKLKDFNREQQAEIAADYYADVLHGHTDPSNFLPLIAEFQDPAILSLQ